VPATDAATLSRDNAAFAVALYQQLRPQPGNLVFAPASISLAMAMTYAGAAGQTATQMADAMHFTLPPAALHPAFDALDLALQSRHAGDGTFELSFANAVWDGGAGLLPSFLDTLATNYGAGVRHVDFADAGRAQAAINGWVSDQTHGRIANLLHDGDITPQTALYLTNAVWFQADWTLPFAANSPAGTFHASTGDVTVPLMRGQDQAQLWQGSGYRAASLGYAGNAVSFVALMPDDGTLDAFEAALTPEALARMFKEDASVATVGALSLPRFAFAQRVVLKDALAALGMTDAFLSGTADFSGINGQHDLFISRVIHQATIAVNEKGTEAAAATAVGIVRKSAPLSSLVIDRPFLFFIRDDATGALLFAGRVTNPLLTE